MKVPRNWTAEQIALLKAEFTTIDYLPDLAQRLGKSVPALYYMAEAQFGMHRPKRVPPPPVALGRINAVLVERYATADLRALADELHVSVKTIVNRANEMRLKRALKPKRPPVEKPNTVAGIVQAALAARPDVQLVVQQWGCGS